LNFQAEKPLLEDHLLNNDYGSGLNAAVYGLNGDKKPEIVVANKNGVFHFGNILKWVSGL